MRVSSFAWTWRADDEIRCLFAEGIDLAAQRIESNLPKVIGRKQPAVQSAVRHTSAKIAATLRSYAVDVMLGGVERERALPDKFSSALVSASWGRWEDLATAEPQPAVERFIKRFGARLVVAVILIAAAFLVPIWLHGWLGDAATQFRIALVTAAVLGLTQAPKTAIERLANYLPSVASRGN
jgi:hypothetical protein